ncbi:MAG: hypothetical protein WKF88_05035 [Ferruginibacter sp.]
MKFVLLIFLAALTAENSNAQFITNVYWTDESSRLNNDIIYYDPAKPLTWPDFKGVPGPPGPVAAITNSGFGYKAGMKSSQGTGQINIGVYCFFDKDKSWVKPGKDTKYILNHEQHHFDVSFLAAGVFMDKVRNAGLTPANFNTILPKLYRECCDLMNNMQHEYDGQTMNGQIEAIQEKWNGFFAAKVPFVTK